MTVDESSKIADGVIAVPTPVIGRGRYRDRKIPLPVSSPAPKITE